MGYPSNKHIKKFCEGQKIKEISGSSLDFEIVFENGEALKVSHWSNSIVCTPYGNNGSVKQSIDIMAV